MQTANSLVVSFSHTSHITRIVYLFILMYFVNVLMCALTAHSMAYILYVSTGGAVDAIGAK